MKRVLPVTVALLMIGVIAFILFGDSIFTEAPTAELVADVDFESTPSETKDSQNPLYGKTAVFDGDSICASPYAWADRIGNDNGMRYMNYSVSGGTITEYVFDGTSYKHSVCGTIDKMYKEFPDADYIILEGGTNDADLLGGMINGHSADRFGSFDPADFSGNYDYVTFCGAVETLLYKAKQYWPDKKIGFIIAMKMGESPAGYDKEHHNRRAYFETLMRICDKWEIPYINLWDDCEMNPSVPEHYNSNQSVDWNSENSLYRDGQHPTAKGYDIIVPMIEAWMKTL